MADKIQNRRGNKATLPTLDVGEIGLCQDTEEVFIGGKNRNIPVLTLTQDMGKPLGIDVEAKEGSGNLITSDAVFKAMQSGGGGINFTTDESLTLTEDGVLKVNTAEAVEEDNSLPVTSAAVFVEIGNIDALLRTI